MRFYRDHTHANLSASSVVTIGNFDGVHLGHKALIGHCRELAGEAQEVVVVTFEPLPQAWFSPQRAPARLTGAAHRLSLLRDAGVDLVWMMRFNGRLASMGPREFVAKILVSGLGAKHVVLGEDFRFGKDREGDLAMMRTLGTEFGFGCEVVEAVTCKGKRVSSTVVRASLAAGRLDEVSELLGRPFSLLGRVVRGQQLGRELGYPTANVRPPPGANAAAGIFAVRARLEGGEWMDAVASLGRRPVVGGDGLLLEVHLFDFDGDLYGRRLETEFVYKIRDEADFPSLDALVARMAKDEEQAKAVLASSAAATVKS